MLKLKNIYLKPMAEDGQRVLVDILWPEGLKTQYAAVDQWLRQLAPSYDLQRFKFDREKWEDYKQAYLDELMQGSEKEALLKELGRRGRAGSVTLLHAGQDGRYSNAAIVKELLESQFK